MTLLILFLATYWISTPWEISGYMVIQNDKNCGSLRYPIESKMYDRNEDKVISHSTSGDFRGYTPDRECVLSIIGKEGFQFEVIVKDLQVDQNAVIDPKSKQPIKCYDYLKIYDGPRADNARLLTPRVGLCGRIPYIKFRTCTSFVTFEFWTGPKFGELHGFTIEILQYPWVNVGYTYTGKSITPGLTWSCFMKEFQDTWDKKSELSSEIFPGASQSQGPYQRHLQDGISCYSCDVCQVDYYRPRQHERVEHCYLCAKIFVSKRADARRECYSQSQYMALLRSLGRSPTDIENAEKTPGFLGCRQYSDEYSTVRTFCFCNSNLCNSANYIQYVHVAKLITFLFILVNFLNILL